MNKQEILKKLKQYNFDKNEYIILSTAALTLMGIKEKASDIDLAVSKRLYNQIRTTYKGKIKEKDVYTFDCFDVGICYYDKSNVEYIETIPVSNLKSIIKLKKTLNREKDKQDINLINTYLLSINPLVLAYLGDSIYEYHIRKKLIQNKICKVNDLQKISVQYVSAKAQSKYLKQMADNNFLNEKELKIVKNARNHKSHSSKTTDIITYKKATGLEALIGYLHLLGENDRIREIMSYIEGD